MDLGLLSPLRRTLTSRLAIIQTLGRNSSGEHCHMLKEWNLKCYHEYNYELAVGASNNLNTNRERDVQAS